MVPGRVPVLSSEEWFSPDDGCSNKRKAEEQHTKSDVSLCCQPELQLKYKYY